ncbi:MAG: response regulator [Dysgonamonadaceae bacterium]|jgi:signal transduction histidine kinase/CheY-like chemotaxis protein|nr:response regulator [Dysgonamonadaceae bacterium]
MHRTKIIIITGYVLLVSLSIFGIVWIYTEWLNYLKGTTPYSQYQKELTVLSNTLATMYHAEGTIEALAFITDPHLNQKYDSLMIASFDQIVHLKEISREPVLLAQLDSLNILLLQKKANTTELFRLIQLFETDTLKKLTQTTILSQHDLNGLDTLLNNAFEQFQDTNLIVGEKKGVFRRIRDAIASSGKDTLREINSYSTLTKREMVLPILKDTIVEMIYEINQTTQKRNAKLTAKLLIKQNELYTINERTTAQINRIMNELENNEYNNNLKLLAEQTEAIRQSSIITSIIAIASILVAVFFMSWILHSLTISQQLHQEIKVAKKRLEELLASREQLMLTITHDIKAPVSSIMGYLELMLKDKSSSQDSYYIGNMQQSATHILNLVQNLLDFHSLEINEQKPDQLAFSPSILLSDIYRSFIPVARKKKLQLDFLSDVEKDVQYVSDPYRIRQIINNILSNAIKYTPAQGSIVFSARLLRNDPDKTELHIAVQDTGPGIREEDRQRIFEAFKRLDYTGSGVEGFGLGLNISIKMAQLLGGSITVDSTVGKGSVFTIVLPLYSIHPDETLPATNRSVDILFIDDDPIQLDLVSRITGREGMRPHTCSRSLDALQLLQEKHFDIIFSDIQMPDMNGFELVERIRMADFAGAKTIPIIGLSANSYVSQARFKKVGFSAFLVKPFTFDQLIQTILHYTAEQPAKDSENLEKQKPKGFEKLIAFAGDDEEAGKAIIRSFIANNQKNYQRLEQAFDADDWKTIRNVSHKMLPLMKMISDGTLITLLEKYNAGSQDKENQTLVLHLIEETIREAEQFINKHIKD